MSDIIFTASNVVPDSDARTASGICAEAIEAGESVMVNSSGLLELADALSAAQSVARGIAVDNAAPGQPLTYVVEGRVSFGAGVFQPGYPYLLSHNPGGIKPPADIGGGQYTTTLGIAEDDEFFRVKIHAPGFPTNGS